MWISLKFFEGTDGLDLSIFNHTYTVRKVQEVNCMGYKNTSFVLEQALKDFFEDPLSDVGIKG